MPKHWSEDTALVDAIARNLYEALPLLPKRLVRLDAITREFGMPFSQVQVLCILSEQDMSIGEISAVLGIAKPNITPLVDALRARGILERSRSEADRRIVNVRLLPEGRDLANRLRQRIAEQVMAWPASFSHSEVKRLNNAMATLVRAAQELAQAENSPEE